MAINKVTMKDPNGGGKVLIDLTSDTVTPEELLTGITAHDKTGKAIVGTRSENMLTMTAVPLNTVDLINKYHDQYSADLPDDTWYRYMTNHRVSGGKLGGGRWYVEGVKSTKDWEWQMARTYMTLEYGGLCFRVKQSGVWQPWVKIQ